MPEWLFSIYAIMQPRLYAEELVDQVATLQATNGRRIADIDYHNFRRDLQLRMDGGQIRRGIRPRSIQALQRLAGVTVESAVKAKEAVSEGGVLLPAGVGA